MKDCHASRIRPNGKSILELPGGSDPLLEVIPLEALGLEPDLKNQRLRVLPISSSETYLTIL